MLPRAGFSEYFIEQRTAAGAKERCFDKGIFFLKAVDDLLALIERHRRIEDHLAFFLCAFDDFGIWTLRNGWIGSVGNKKNQSAYEKNAASDYFHICLFTPDLDFESRS